MPQGGRGQGAMADQKHGLVAAIQSLGPGSPPADEAEQAALFDDFEPDVPMLVSPIERKAGRPKGARNKSTEQWRQYLLSRYRSPLVGLLELYSRSPADLAEELGLYAYHEGKLMVDREGNPVLATGEAFKAQLAAMIAALPYLHQKLPQAIDVKTPERGVLVLNFGEPSQSDESDVRIVDVQENQRVIDVTPARSDNDLSDAARKLLEHNDD